MADEATPATAASAPAALPEAVTKLDPAAAAAAIMRGETPVTEPAKPAAPATPEMPAAEPAEERLSSGFASLARQKAKLLGERKALEAERAEIKSLKEERAKLAVSAAAVLDMFPGLSRQQALEKVATDYLASVDGVQPPSTDDRLAELQARIDAREKAEKDARDKEQADAQASNRQAAITAAVDVVKTVLDRTPDAYPTITALGEQEQVFDALNSYVKLHKIPHDQVTPDLISKIAPAIEQALAEEYSSLVGKVPHIAARVATPQKTETPTRNPTDSGAQGNSSNSLASNLVSGAPPHQPVRRHTVEELNKMALALFNAPA